jgi:uncharacterized spore protein YtfJ
MANRLEELASVIISQLKEIAASDTVVGRQVTLGNKSVVPITRVMVGFGVGGGEGQESETKSGFGGGGGGGVRVEPVGFIIIEEDKVSFLPVGKTKYEGLVAAIPELITRLKDIKDDGKKKKQAKGETSGPEPPSSGGL